MALFSRCCCPPVTKQFFNNKAKDYRLTYIHIYIYILYIFTGLYIYTHMLILYSSSFSPLLQMSWYADVDLTSRSILFLFCICFCLSNLSKADCNA